MAVAPSSNYFFLRQYLPYGHWLHRPNRCNIFFICWFTFAWLPVKSNHHLLAAAQVTAAEPSEQWWPAHCVTRNKSNLKHLLQQDSLSCTFMHLTILATLHICMRQALGCYLTLLHGSITLTLEVPRALGANQWHRPSFCYMHHLALLPKTCLTTRMTLVVSVASTHGFQSRCLPCCRTQSFNVNQLV